MSSALLRRSLAICDPTIEESRKEKSKRNKKIKELQARVTKLNKNEIIKSDRKISVQEARQKLQQKKQILEHNLKLIKLSKKARKVNLNQEITEKIIERAVTRKPISNKPPEKKEEQTAFTEEDFKKFEAEYLDY